MYHGDADETAQAAKSSKGKPAGVCGGTFSGVVELVIAHR
jgi:hypothetical protein